MLNDPKCPLIYKISQKARQQFLKRLREDNLRDDNDKQMLIEVLGTIRTLYQYGEIEFADWLKSQVPARHLESYYTLEAIIRSRRSEAACKS